MNEVVEVVADWLIIAYAVFILFFALVIVSVELLKERGEKKIRQVEERDKEWCEERKNTVSSPKELQGRIRYELNTFYAQMSCLFDKDVEGRKSVMNIPTELPEQMRHELNTFYAQMSFLLDKVVDGCSAVDKGRWECIVNEVIHRIENELKYGSIDEALSDTLETCVVRLKSTLPGEEAR